MRFKQNSQVKIPKTIKSNPSSSDPLMESSSANTEIPKRHIAVPGSIVDVGHINCTIEDVDKNAPVETKVEFSILARPYIRDTEMYSGDVTITISKNGSVVESTYTIYYFLNGAWRAVIHKRLGAPLTLTDVVEELCWILPSHIDDAIDEETEQYLHFNTHLAEEFAKRIKYFSRHIKLTKRYAMIIGLILGEGN